MENKSAALINKTDKLTATTTTISNKLKDILVLEKEILEITNNLDQNSDDINNYKNRNFIGKMFNSKEIKWENHANNVYKAIDLNLRLNKNNTTVIIEIFHFLVSQDQKIKENLNSMSKITSNANNHLSDYVDKMKKLERFQEELKNDKKKQNEEMNQIIEKLNEGDPISKKLAEVLFSQINPEIKKNTKRNQLNLEEIKNTQNQIKGIDDYILELHQEINTLNNKILTINKNLADISKKNNETNFLKKLSLLNIALLIIFFLGFGYFKIM